MNFQEMLYEGLPGENHRQSVGTFTTTNIDTVIIWAKNMDAQPARKIIQTPKQEIAEPRLRFNNDSNPSFEPVNWAQFIDIFIESRSGFNFKPSQPNHSTRQHFFLSISSIKDRFDQYFRPTTRPDLELDARQRRFKGLGTTDWRQIASWLEDQQLQPIGRERPDGVLGLYFADQSTPSKHSISPSVFMQAMDYRGLALLLQNDGQHAFFPRRRFIWPEIFPLTDAQPR